MAAECLVSYERVAGVADVMHAKGVNPTVDIVIAVTGGRRDYVRQHLKEWWKKKRAEIKALIENALNEKLKIVILKDREDFARSYNASLYDEKCILEDECTSMEEELSGLYTERDTLSKLLNNERESHVAKVNAVEHINSNLSSTLQSIKEENDALQSELEKAKDNCVAAEKKLSGLRLTQVQRNAEMKAELTLARKQVAEAKAGLDSAKAGQEAAEKAAEQLTGQVVQLTSQLEELQKKILKETLLRIKAEELLAPATATTESPQADCRAKVKKKGSSSQKKPSANPKTAQSTAAEIKSADPAPFGI